MTTPNKEAFEAWYNHRFANATPNAIEHGAEDMEEAYLAACAEKDKVIAELVEALTQIKNRRGSTGLGAVGMTAEIAEHALTKHEAQGE